MGMALAGILLVPGLATLWTARGTRVVTITLFGKDH
jgi:hypothetical protein